MTEPAIKSLIGVCNELCESIEDVILERGLFTQFLGENLDVNVNVVPQDGQISLQVVITSEKLLIEHAQLVEMTSYVHAKFFEHAKRSLKGNEFRALKKVWLETILIKEGEIIFGIDD